MRRIVGAYRKAFRGLPREVWCLALVFLISRAGWTVVSFLVL